MKKSVRKIAALVLAASLFYTQHVFSAQVQEIPEPKKITKALLMDEILEIADSNHKRYYTEAGGPVFDNLLQADLDHDLDTRIGSQIRENSLTGWRSSYRPEEIFMTRAEAVADVAFLFDFFRSSYPGYYAFGGDAVFIPMQQAMEQEIDTWDGPVTPFDLTGLLQEQLYEAVPDRHLVIDGNVIDKSEFSYWADALDLYKDDAGYYQITDGDNKLYLEQCRVFEQDKELVWQMKPSLNEQGGLVYRIATSYPKNKEIKAIAKFSGKKSVTEELKLSMVYGIEKTSYEPVDELWRLDYTDGIPILSCKSFSPWGKEQDESMEAFIETGLSLKEEPYLILDLRGNVGGNANYAVRWLENFTGFPEETPEGLSVYDQLGSLATLVGDVTTATFNEMWGDYEEWHEHFYSLLPDEHNSQGWVLYLNEGVKEKLANDTVVFVLMDNACVSAGEYFIAYLMMFENVVLIGESTAGQFHFGASRNLFLPNSGIGIFCGANMFLLPSGEVIEGTGFEPDIFWSSKNSYETVIQLIRSLS